MSAAAALAIEQFAEYVADPEAVWALVADPRRLVAWTGLEPCDQPPAAYEEGQLLPVLDGGTVRELRVVTATRGVVEVVVSTECGEVGIGVRVVGEPVAGGRGPGFTRLVTAARVTPAHSAVRARMVDVPRLRRRFDAWARAVRSELGG